MDRRKLGKYAADIFLPNRCCFCDRVIEWDKLACGECIEAQPTVGDVKVGVEGVKECFCVFRYKDRVRELIYELKHTGMVNNFAELSAQRICGLIGSKGADIGIVTYVPMFRAKRLKRGYDQAQLIAKFVGDILKKPVSGDLIGRTSDKAEQHKMTKQQRSEHAEKIFFPNENAPDISGKNILICDDVITTGSTMRVCAGILKDMGAKDIYCCSAAATFLEAVDEK